MRSEGISYTSLVRLGNFWILWGILNITVLSTTTIWNKRYVVIMFCIFKNMFHQTAGNVFCTSTFLSTPLPISTLLDLLDLRLYFDTDQPATYEQQGRDDAQLYITQSPQKNCPRTRARLEKRAPATPEKSKAVPDGWEEEDGLRGRFRRIWSPLPQRRIWHYKQRNSDNPVARRLKKDDCVGVRLPSTCRSWRVPEGQLLRTQHTDGGETSRRMPLNIRPRSSNLVNKIIHNTGREILNQFINDISVQSTHFGALIRMVISL